MRTMILFLLSVALVACGEFSSGYSDYQERSKRAAADAENSPGPPVAPVERPEWRGPFGLQAGLGVSELEAAGIEMMELEPWSFAAEAVPVPHSEFDMYYFEMPSGTGLCSITASGKDFPADAHGTAIRARFNELRSALEDRYGEPTRSVDASQRGSVFSGAEHFTLALERGERSLNAVWEIPEAEGSEHGVAAVALAAMAPKYMTGAVTLQYRLGNYDACQREISALKNRAL